MGIVAIISNTQTPYTVELISQSGALATISLIISLSIAVLLADTIHWDRWTSSSLDACSNSLLITFAAIVVFKIMLIL